MAHVHDRTTEKTDTPAPAVPNGAAPSGATCGVSVRPQKALALTNGQGHQASAWRDAGAWVIESDDPVLKRRIQRAFRKPLWVREDVPGPDGERWSTLVQLHPDDPRYANQVFWNWHQLPLRDVHVQVVTLPDRRPVRQAT